VRNRLDGEYRFEAVDVEYDAAPALLRGFRSGKQYQYARPIYMEVGRD
jgi:hypothetical protein